MLYSYNMAEELPQKTEKHGKGENGMTEKKDAGIRRQRAADRIGNTRRLYLIFPVGLVLAVILYLSVTGLGRGQYRKALLDADARLPEVRENAEFYNALTAREQTVFRAMEDAADACAEETAVIPFVPEEKEFRSALDALIYEHPEDVALEPSAFVLLSSEETAAVRMAYREDADTLRGKTDALIDRILSGNSADTDEGTALFLHDALASLAVCADGTEENIGTNAYDALTGVPSDSRAYALAYALLCSRAGLSCVPVTGYGNGQKHVWNEVRTEESVFYTDVFWDDTARPDVALPFHGYYGLSRAEIEKDHAFETAVSDISGDTHADYYEADGLYAGPDGLPALLGTLLNDARCTGRGVIEFRCAEELSEDSLSVLLAVAVRTVNTDGAGPLLRPECRIYRASRTRPCYTVQLFYETTGA